MNHPTNTATPAKFLLYLPFYAAVPVLYALLFLAFDQPLHWGAFGIGALGWLAALVLRGPIAVISHKLMKEHRAKLTVVASSGPLEEGVRLAVLALTSFSLSNAVSIGQGWAAIEVVYSVINGLMILVIINKKDEKSAQALQILEQQGMRTDLSPLVGVIERVTASAFHIGATLLIAYEPWLVLLLIPAHSLLNLGAVRFVKASIFWTEVYVGIVGFAVLTAGMLVHLQIGV